jgi:uroporphyrinogen decarboxylase
VQFGEASASLISRKHYEELVWPLDRYVIEVLKKQGIYVFLHVCGNSTRIFDLMVESGADCLEFDSQVDIAWAKARAGKKVAIKGNINTSSFLTLSPDEMGRECDRILEAAKPGGGFILCGGCEVPADSPDDVIRAVRHSVDRSGKYCRENAVEGRTER